MISWLLLLAIVAILGPFALALPTLLMGGRTAAWRGRIALLAPLSIFLIGAALWSSVGAGQRLHVPLVWIPSLDVHADLVVDRLGSFFVLLIGGVGLGVFQYARKYLGAKAKPTFWPLMLAFTGAMLGIVLSDSLLLLYVFWELTTVSSALLVAQASDDAPAKRGALQAFLVTAGGGLSLLVGILLLGQSAGTYSLSALVARGPELVADPAHHVPLVLLLVGAFTKSAQVPFHFWLPGAMAAPAPVSAYLHSATMVKAGVFLVARLYPIFSESPLWLPLLTAVGLTSFVIAGWNALWSDDVKELLAYSTIAYLGLLFAHYGYSARVGLRGELVNIANHALYKSALFLLVGWVEKATGTRDLRTLARERWPRREPVGTALFGLGALALAGSPLLLGFLSKELFLEAVIGGSGGRLTFPVVVVVVAGGLAAAYGLKIFVAMLFGSESPPADRPGRRGGASRWLLVVPACLLAPQVLGGLFPRLLLSPFAQPDAEVPSGLALWHAADAMLAMSLSSFALGGLLFLAWVKLNRPDKRAIGARAAALVARATLAVASASGRLLQAGGSSRFNAIILVGALAAAAAPLVWKGLRPPYLAGFGLEPHLGWLPAAVTSGAALLVVLVRRRVVKAVMLSLVGYGVAFFYVVFRAPDLVLTQVLVETVSLVLLLLAFRRLPPLGDDRRPGPARLIHGLVAAAFGGTMALLAWSAGQAPAPDRTGALQAALSWPVAHGRNAVNVILVDFRGIDTFGEIVVLVIAALGVLALLGALRPGAPGPRAPAGKAP
jgi:multicomponent K+:H+ antiporter subunit A